MEYSQVSSQVLADRKGVVEARHRALTEVPSVGIFRADTAGNFLFVNPLFMAITGYDCERTAAHEWVHVVHPDDATRVVDAWTAYLAERGTGPRHRFEFRILRPEGRIAWVLAQLHPEYDVDGQLVGHVGTITDVTTLKLAQVELQQANDLLEQRVRERTRELETAKDAAEQSDRVKTAFLSSMSHELRTPLNAILGFSDVLLGGHAGPLNAEQARQLGMVRGSAARLRALVEDLLDISRIVAGQVDLDLSVTDMRSVVVGRLPEFAAEAARKGLRLDLRAPAALPPVRTDARRVAQVVDALLSNAVRFTDSGAVTVELRAEPDRIECVVSDTGAGIPQEALGRLFDPFAQVARPGGRLLDGTALGLAIARHRARALGGDVQGHSELGRGSRFTLWLPGV